MDPWFLRSDGRLEWRPDHRTVERITRSGAFVIYSLDLCTACLVGSWSTGMLRAGKTLCADCTWLEETVTELSGAERSTRAGRPAGGILRLGPTNAVEEAAWEPIRAARDVRDERLAAVFAHAEELEVPIEEPRGGVRARAVALADVERFDLIPGSNEARVERFDEWLRILAPDDYATRAGVLADVAELASLMHDRQAEDRRARRRAELDRATHEAAAALATLGGATRAIGTAAVNVVRARRALS